MINADMRLYNYYTAGSDGYGSPTIKYPPLGQVKMSINITSADDQANTAFYASEYVGIMVAGNTRLAKGHYVDIGEGTLVQVQTIYKKGRYWQVFMKMTGYGVPFPPDEEEEY